MESIISSDYSKLADVESSYVDLTKPIANWFKPCTESINPPKVKEVISDKISLDTTLEKINIQSDKLCKSIIGCASVAIKGFEFCHKHILEDKSSPFRRCSFISKTDYRRCRNPTPILGDKRSYCILHDKELRKRKDVSKSKKKRRSAIIPLDKPNKKRPSTLPVSVTSGTSSSVNTKGGKISSSDEEEFSFFTDTVQVNKTDCLWLGNQASDAESTDSEDENLLNHAGVWTLEECIRILKEKMIRIRYLYSLQYKRLNHCLKEERRKMLKEYDMDSFTLSKVGFDGCSAASFEKFAEDINLSNYQKLIGPELITEKLWKEKRKGVALHTRKNDLPRCMHHVDGNRCFNKVLPLSKFCFNHVCNDDEQHLFTTCTFRHSDGKNCLEAANTFSSYCDLHDFLSYKSYKKSLELFQSAKLCRENRKRKMEGKEREKKEIRSKRSSVRLKEFSSPIANMEIQPKVIIHNYKDKSVQEKDVQRLAESETTMSSENKIAKYEGLMTVITSALNEVCKESAWEGTIFEKDLNLRNKISVKSNPEININSKIPNEVACLPSHVDISVEENKGEVNKVCITLPTEKKLPINDSNSFGKSITLSEKDDIFSDSKLPDSEISSINQENQTSCSISAEICTEDGISSAKNEPITFIPNIPTSDEIGTSSIENKDNIIIESSFTATQKNTCETKHSPMDISKVELASKR